MQEASDNDKKQIDFIPRNITKLRSIEVVRGARSASALTLIERAR
jgi:hypothetical protein